MRTILTQVADVLYSKLKDNEATQEHLRCPTNVTVLLHSSVGRTEVSASAELESSSAPLADLDNFTRR